MNILVNEILEKQRAFGEAIGIITGIVRYVDDDEIKENIIKYLTKVDALKFSNEFWEAVIEYSKLKSIQDEQ